MAKMMSYRDDIRKIGCLNLPWEKLSGKNILITGATGLIGSTVVDVLLNRPNIDYEIYASGRNFDRISEKLLLGSNIQHLHFLKYDVTTPLLSDIDFHFIISAASGANPIEYATNPVGIIKANIIGTDNLLSYGIGHKLERFVYVSSGEVYGEGDGRVFTENYSGYVDCTSVRSCYPTSKRAAESLCIAYAHQYGINVSIARLSHVFGPNFTENDNRVYAQFIRNVLKGEDIVMKSSGEQFRSWCYVVDCASALLYIMLKGENGLAYNVADGKSNISIKELASIIAGIANKKVKFNLPSTVEKQGFNIVSKSVFDTQRLEEIGWHTLGESIQKNLEKTIDEVKYRNQIQIPKPKV